MPEAPISARPHAFYIRPAPGWLECLHEEVKSIVATPIQKYKYEPKITLLKGVVKLHRCDWRQGLEVMLRTTTAHDVEWMILESKCTKWSEVEAILSRVPWDEVLPDRTVPVHVTPNVFQGFTTHSAKLRELLCRAAQVEHVSEGGEFRFKIELKTDFLKISVSLCGEPLYKRGYKAKLTATAPLPEHQAAACTRWVLEQEKNWSSISTVFVPFAGTGTLGFESLIVLSGAGVGSFIRDFSCDKFPCVSEATMRFLRRKLQERLQNFSGPKLLFNEINPEACLVLKENTQSFSKLCKGMESEIQEGDLFLDRLVPDGDGKILVLLNPPYGDRLAKSSSVTQLYSRLGKFLRESLKPFEGRVLGGCLCPDKSSWNHFLQELKAKSAETHHFTHGGKEMRLVRWS
ncbi:MAG: hypothetical protein FJ112_11110 [Deltaproteobacteria bacterium]|nr:hypothetical protein [Deltaproteobacteria bacterium]